MVIWTNIRGFLKGRVFVAWLLATTLFVTAGLSISDWAQRDAFALETERAAYEIAKMQERDKQLVAKRYQRAIDQILFLTRVPPIAGIRRALANQGFDARDGDTLARWLSRLQALVEALVLSDPAIYSVEVFDSQENRVLALAGRSSDDPIDLGIDRVTSIPLAMALSGLTDQPQAPQTSGIYRIGAGPLAGRPVFQAALALPISDLGQHYVVKITGAVTDLIGDITTSNLRGVVEWLVDEQGRFISAPEAGKIFGLAPAANVPTFQTEFTQLPSDTWATPEGLKNTSWVQDRAGQKWLMLSEPMLPKRPSAQGGLSPVVLYSGLPLALLEQRAEDASRLERVMIWAMCLAIVGLMLMAVLSRWAVVDTETQLTTDVALGDQLRPLSNLGGAHLAFAVAVGIVSAALVYLIVGVALPDLPFPYMVMFSSVLFASTFTGFAGGVAASAVGALAALDLGTTSSPLMDFSGVTAWHALGATFMMLSGVALSYFQERTRVAGLIALQAEHQRAVEAQKAQEVLLAETAQRALIMQTAGEGIHVLDHQGNLVMFNPAFCEMLGYSEEEAKSLRIWDWEASFQPEEIGQALDNMFSAETIQVFTSRHKRKDATYYDAEVSYKSVTIQGERFLFLSARDITARLKADHELKRRLAERETLLDEVHHRVKNNLQVVSGLLMLQQLGSNNETVREQLQISRDRISAIARIHEQLYKGARFDSIDFRWYTQELFETMNSASDLSGRGVSLVLRDGTFSLPLQEAVPCGLLLHELVSNAIKHAFPDGRRGKVWVALSQMAEGGRIMEVGDDGVGMPDSVQDLGTLGLDLVHRLAAQLGATLRRQPSAVGTVYALELPELRSENTERES